MRRFAQFLIPLVALSTLALHASAERAAGSRSRDTWAIAAPAAPSPREAATLLLARSRASLAGGDTVELDAPLDRVSLTGTHFLFAQKIGAIPVLNGGVSVSVRSDGTASIHDRTGLPASGLVRVGRSEAIVAALEPGLHLSATDVERVDLVAWVGDDEVARTYQRVILLNGLRRYAVFVDAESGCVAWSEPLFWTARGQVFDANPVTTLNDTSLLDGDDSDASVPPGAYSSVELPGLVGSGSLAGPHATIVDVELPTTTRADQSSSLDFTRSRDEFEEVNVYFQIDRAQRYLEGLGFVGDRAVVGYPIEVDAHAGGGVDDSSYRFSTPGRGRLYFGDGGVDDAEDADIVLHEFGHAIEDSIVPSGFTGPSPSEPRALGEGFCDYWAFSSSWSRSRATGRDPFCIGDWDARCSPGPSTRCTYDPGSDCLRRVDGTKTMADYIRGGSSGTEHRNGEIWSSALREIFVKSVTALGDVEGRKIVDRTIIESHFGMPPNPSFRTAALRLIDADRRLNRGLLAPSICIAMSARGIVDSSDCDLGLRGDLTLIESPARNVAIPDNNTSGVTAKLRVSDTRTALEVFVRVNIAHPRRGDLRLTLSAPDGASVVLQVENGDSGADIKATYGLDAEPSQPLSTLAGKSAAGDWTLRVTDTFGVDEGRLVSWGMMFRFAGDAPITTRGSVEPVITFPVAGSVDGAFGTQFVSDARIANIGASTARATIFFTPSGANGTTTFSSVRIEIPPGEIVALDDFVTSLFRESGTGTVDIRWEKEGPRLVATSRIYNDTEAGTYGQFVRSDGSPGNTSSHAPLDVLHLSNGTAARSNLGLTEIWGGAGRVEVRLIDSSGATIGTEFLDIAPLSHVQIPLLGGAGGTSVESFRAEVSVISGSAMVVAYGSVVDNASGDAMFVPSSNSAASPFPMGDEPYVIPAVIRADGENGTHWRSDVRILNHSSAGDVELRFAPADGSAALTRPIPIGSEATATIDDVLQTLFGLAEGRGSLTVTRVGGTTPVSLVVTSRTWTPGAAGSYGQFIPAVAQGDAPGRGDGAVHLIHVDSNDAFRCNAGVTEVAGKPAVVRIRLFDASGTERFATNVSVPAHGNVQFNLAAAGAPWVSNGRLVFEVIEGDGWVLPYASIIDNETGDPIFVSQ